MGKQWKPWQTLFLESKITADGDCSHEIKSCLLLGRKAMINLDSILKSREFTLSTKVLIVKAMVFRIVMYGRETWAIKKAEWRKIDAFKLWSWRRLLSPLDCKEIQPINPKGNPPWLFTGRTNAEAEAPTSATWCKELTDWKRPWCWERLKAGGEGEDRGWGGWMASLIQWTWIWANSVRWWRTEKPGMLQSMGSQRVGHDWVTEQQKCHLILRRIHGDKVPYFPRFYRWNWGLQWLCNLAEVTQLANVCRKMKIQFGLFWSPFPFYRTTVQGPGENFWTGQPEVRRSTCLWIRRKQSTFKGIRGENSASNKGRWPDPKQKHAPRQTDNTYSSTSLR